MVGIGNMSNWEAVIDRVEKYTEELGIPEVAFHRAINKEDFIPEDPSNISGKDLSDKLFEYSSYVSFLNAELGRIDAQYTAISTELSATIEEVSLVNKISKNKAKATILLENPDMKKAEKRLVELECLQKRIIGLRDGFNVRLQACSREVSIRSLER